MSILRLQASRLLRPATGPAASAGVWSRGYAASVHGNDPKIIEEEKQRNLKGQQDSSSPHKNHAPGWNEHLASNSEAAVKADQAGPTGKPGKDLQDATVSQTHKKHHEKSSSFSKTTESEDDVRADAGPGPRR
ncbi:hypothetical protein I204_07237 [Kwoniella mangroviensis CBS 8886]|nr:hypothetical protein I204_07237 [Kwoniella mangroviensis CBS 8886]